MPSSSRAPNAPTARSRVVLAADPGQQYRFASVELPGLAAAGSGGRKASPGLRRQGRRSGHCLRCDRGGHRTDDGARREGLCQRQGRRAADRGQSPDPPREPGAAGHIRGRSRRSAQSGSAASRRSARSMSRRSPVSSRATCSSGRRSTICAARSSPRRSCRAPTSSLSRRMAGGRSTSPCGWSPRRRHTIAGELGYGTGQGARVEASWSDRNFFNPEGALTLARRRRHAGAARRRSVPPQQFLQRDQVLNLQASAGHQKFDAYEAKTDPAARQYRAAEQLHLAEEVDLDLRRRTPRAPTSAACSTGRASRKRAPSSSPPCREPRVRRQRQLARSDPRIPPERPAQPRILRARRRASPMRAPRSTRAPIIRFPTSVVAAGRIRLGTIVGASAFDIAPSRRFYSGGGGSVRGYGYQQLGPKDVDGDPIGGRGLAEFALEARIRLKQFGGNFGIVPFFDGGSLTTTIAARTSATGDSRRVSAFAIIRASVRSASTSACRSTGRRATDPSR